MSYTTPTITASGTTLAQLKAGGVEGQIDRLIAANTFSANTVALLHFPRNLQSDRMWAKISQDVHRYLSGKNIPAATTDGALLQYATVLKTQLAAIEEIAVLAAAATRTATTTINPAGTQADTTIALS